MKDKALLTRPELAPARDYFVMACVYSRVHDRMAKIALDQYGDHGSLISGCVRDHFPDPVKDCLRYMAQRVTYYCAEADKARPRGVRHWTIVALGKAVARRDGVGYYGPRA